VRPPLILSLLDYDFEAFLIAFFPLPFPGRSRRNVLSFPIR